MRSKSLTLSIVGAGRVGRSLAALLRKRGWRIGAVVTRSLPSARAAARAIGAGEPHAKLSDRLLSADVVLIATPDREIERVALALARLGGARWRRKVVLHTSGALDSRVLRPLKRCGASVGSLHPLQTFSGRTIPALAGSVCTIEGRAAALAIARRICRDLGSIPVAIPGSAKPVYHCGAALAAGHLLAVMEAATRVLMAAGFSRRNAVKALLPLTRQTLANFERFGPRQAWTGPLSRGDFGVVKRHLAALRPFPREFREAYEALSWLGLRVLAPSNEARSEAKPAATRTAKRKQLERALRSSRRKGGAAFKGLMLYLRDFL